MAETIRTIADQLTRLGDSAAAHSTNREMIRDIVVSGPKNAGTLNFLEPRFGAVGNGVADDANAFTLAFAEALSTGLPIHLPRRDYNTASQITSAGNVVLIAEPGTRILKGHAGNGFRIEPTAVLTGTATAQGDNSILRVTGASFTANQYVGQYVEVITTFGGLGRTQRRKIMASGGTDLSLEYVLGQPPLTGDVVNIWNKIDQVYLENIEILGTGGNASLVIQYADNVTLRNVKANTSAGNGISIYTGRNVRLYDCGAVNTQFGLFFYGSDDLKAYDCYAENCADIHSIQMKDCRDSAIIGARVAGGAANLSGCRGIDIKCSGLNPTFNCTADDCSVVGVKGAAFELYGSNDEGDGFHLESSSITNCKARAGINVPSVGIRLLNESPHVMKSVRASEIEAFGCGAGLFVSAASDVEVANCTFERNTGRSTVTTGANRVKLSNIIWRNNNYNLAGTDRELRITDSFDVVLDHCSFVHTDANGKSIGPVQETGTSDRTVIRDPVLDDSATGYTTFYTFAGTSSLVAGVTRKRQAVAYAASVSPNHMLGPIVDIGLLTGNLSIGVGTNRNRGTPMTINTQQDATGGRTYTWNAIYKGVTAGITTANAKNSWTFEWDGTNWNQIYATVGY